MNTGHVPKHRALTRVLRVSVASNTVHISLMFVLQCRMHEPQTCFKCHTKTAIYYQTYATCCPVARTCPHAAYGRCVSPCRGAGRISRFEQTGNGFKHKQSHAIDMHVALSCRTTAPLVQLGPDEEFQNKRPWHNYGPAGTHAVGHLLAP